jgi:o-succinylbenzoate synthase
MTPTRDVTTFHGYVDGNVVTPLVGVISSCCGLEIALLDAIGKAEGCGVCTLLSPAGTAPRASVPVNAVIGARAPGAAIAAAREASNNGYRCVKLKVGLGGSIQEEIERVAAVRDAIGPAVHLRLDANEAWNLEEAIAILSQCVPYNIQYVEQPLKAYDLAGMRSLRRAVHIPIAADEALHSLESAQLILDSEAADIFVVKPQLAGGLRVGQQIIQAASERGIPCVISSTIETGIGLAAALHLAAASPAVTLECGLATLHLLVDDLLIYDLPVRDGLLAVPTGPGLGVVLDWEALDRYS